MYSEYFIKNNKFIRQVILSFISFCILICGTIFILKIATATENNVVVNILEIEPGNSFFITNSNENNKIETYTNNNITTIIEHVTMPEFIGKKDQLNGKYDIIVIGNHIGDNKKNYSGINNEGHEFNGSISSWTDHMYPTGNYVENDITQRKADEIMSYIDSGQLVYIDSDIFSIENTNLKKYFENEFRDNLIKYNNINNNNNNFIDSILSDYFNGIRKSNNEIVKVNKKPNMVVIPPVGTEKDLDNNDIIENRNLEFLVKTSEEDNSRYTVKLYFDINGDGIFTEKECYETNRNVNLKSDYKIYHDIGPEFFGWLEWKIEIVANGSEVKSYKTGSFIIKNIEENYKKNIKVLQIYPGDENDNKNNLDLSSNERFKNILNDNKIIDDYNISIDTISTFEFNRIAGNELKLNGNYNMLIIGFADGFGLKDITSLNALNEIKNFIKTGQSVMFTHDTMALRMESPGIASIELTKFFRDAIGQSRFLDKFNHENQNTTFDDKYIYTDDLYNKYNEQTKLYETKKIPHINLNDQNKKIVGYSRNGKKYLTTTEDVYLINSGLISNYPYKLNNNSDKSDNKFKVATTHNQYYQLNLEDPDVVPLLNLYGNGYDEYDSRNNYYTYCKGNITYSGTGHANNYTDQELKLFVNTIIKAERGANHAPIIKCSINNSETIGGGQDFHFSVNSTDFENDLVKMNVTIDGQELTDENKDSSLELTELDGKKTFDIETGDSARKDVLLKIPKDKLNEVTKEFIEVKITAVDIQGAKSEAIYKINILKSGIDVQFLSANPSKDNSDEIEVKYRVTPQDIYINSNNLNSGGVDEAIILLDLSEDINTGNRYNAIKNELNNFILNSTKLSNIKMGIIGFNDKVYIGSSEWKNNDRYSKIFEINDKEENYGLIEDALYTINSEKEILRLLLQGQKGDYYDYYDWGKGKNIYINGSTRNLDLALKSAKYIFDNFGEDNKNKAIILISCGNLKYSNNILNEINENKYRIITVDMSGNNSSNINEVHQIFAKKNEAYLIHSEDSGGQFNNSQKDMKQVEEYLLRSTLNKNDIITEAKFSIALGDNFIPGTNSKYTLENKDGFYNIDVTNNVQYIATDIKDGNGKTKYSAPSFEVVFNIKLQNQNATGNLGFNSKSYTDYQYMNEQLILGIKDGMSNFNYKYTGESYRKIDIKTPVIKIKTNNLIVDHGIYYGYTYNKPDIVTTKEYFSNGSFVTMGAYITGIERNQKITLKIDDKITEHNIQKIVYINGVGNIIGEKQLNNNDQQYTQSLNELPNGCTKVLIIYSVKLPQDNSDNNREYKNTINVSNSDRDFNALIGIDPDKNELPDLF